VFHGSQSRQGLGASSGYVIEGTVYERRCIMIRRLLFEGRIFSSWMAQMSLTIHPIAIVSGFVLGVFDQQL